MTTLSLPTVHPNRQPVEQVEQGDGFSLDVVEVYHTIQGEGPYTGWPAVFVRTAGCTLQCPRCDTNYTEGRERLDVFSVLEAVVATAQKNTKLIVITGGEPFRQSLGLLVKGLIDLGYKVQIETNGTVFDESMRTVWFNPQLTIVCSPKSKVHFALRPHISHYKYVLDAGHVATDGLPSSVLGLNVRPDRPHAGFYGYVYVQPADEGDDTSEKAEKTNANIETAVRVCQQYGYILSLQTHKVCRIP